MFQENNMLWFSGKSYSQKKWSDRQKLQGCIERHAKLHEHYTLLCKMVIVAIDHGLRMIIENPATTPHYLLNYFPIAPTITDNDRSKRGDYYKKPTNFWFVNCKPNNNVIFEQIPDNKLNVSINHITSKDGIDRQTLRSMISPYYANRFIREFILDKT